MIEQLDKAIAFLKANLPGKPRFAVILGTGLNSFAELLDNKLVIPYEKIPGFVVSTAPDHAGKLIYGSLEQENILVMQGRFHFYEGYSMEEITFPIRVLKDIGIEFLFVTNASGSLNEEMQPGTLVLIEDHLNLMGTNPLIGLHNSRLGSRFPSMNNAYDQELRNLAVKIAEKHNINLKSGVYAGLTGPSLETRAECLMLKGLGADIVGMSTVPEIIVAVQCGLRNLAVSTVTNMSNIFHSQPHSQAEIQRNAKSVISQLKILILELIKSI
ncbi:MAG: purine-nucleoside phosphorylase [Candidatus Cloacimonetes bacterium]|nr:purine-nucleoside phosphorylase [Candidatus Cloacimonadota bacterium]